MNVPVANVSNTSHCSPSGQNKIMMWELQIQLFRETFITYMFCRLHKNTYQFNPEYDFVNNVSCLPAYLEAFTHCGYFYNWYLTSSVVNDTVGKRFWIQALIGWWLYLLVDVKGVSVSQLQLGFVVANWNEASTPRITRIFFIFIFI